MKLVLAPLTCGFCGETMSATIPVSVLHLPIYCCTCGQQSVLADAGAAAVPIPAASPIAQHWRLNLVAETFLHRNGGQWARC